MEQLELVLTTVNKYLWGRWLVYVLLALGVLYTFTNGFIQMLVEEMLLELLQLLLVEVWEQFFGCGLLHSLEWL